MQDQINRSTPLYAALSPRAPAFVQAPTFVFTPVVAAPSRLEVLRCQIAAAEALRKATTRWR